MGTGNRPSRSLGLDLAAFRALTAHSPDVIMVLDLEGEIHFINWTAPGLTPEKVVGTPVYAYVAPAQHADMRATFERVRSSKGPGTYRNVYEVPGGQRLHWESLVAPIMVEDRVVAFSVFSRDVTERDERAAELNRFFELSLDFLCIANDAQFTRVNPTFERVLGFSAEELTSTPYYDFVHPDDVPATRRATERLRSGDAVLGFENRYRTKAGDYRLLAWQAVADRERARVLAVARDVTEERALELQLRQSQKMDAIGQLTGGIAHDFNNLVLAVLGNAEFALEELRPEQTEARMYLEEIETAGKRAASLTRQLLTFSRRMPLSVRAVDLNALVENLLKMLRRLIPEDIELDWRPGAGSLQIAADSGQIEQVLVNLCVNARDAMQAGGRLLIETRLLPVGAPAAGEAPQRKAPEVLLRVADTGQGMTAEVKERMFEPFFSTKGPNKGTGLGLATVYGIVERHRGRIDVTSKVGSGSTFDVYLPTGAPPASETSASIPPQPRSEGRVGEVVLLAEDEDLVRNVVVRMLERAGHRVLAAANGQEAVALLREHRAEVSVAVLDVVMPELSGPETYQQLLELRPDLPALFISGYADGTRTAMRIPEGRKLLGKPLTLDALLGEVEALLAARRG
jgi:PAS domain S-box-containing protein